MKKQSPANRQLRVVLDVQIPRKSWKKLVKKGREWGCDSGIATETEIVTRALRDSASDFFRLANADGCLATIIYEV